MTMKHASSGGVNVNNDLGGLLASDWARRKEALPRDGRLHTGGLTDSEWIRKQINMFANIPVDSLKELATEAFDKALVAIAEVLGTPQEQWDTCEAAVPECEYMAWAAALGKVVISLWCNEVAWFPPDPEAAGENDAA
jgi:hypothetical protein